MTISREILYQNIKQLCDKENISIYQLEKRLGFGRHSLDKCNEVATTWERVAIVANYFGVSVDYLIGNTVNPFSHKSNLSPASTMLLKVSEELQLSEENAKKIVKIIRVMLGQDV